ncbi:hypothetical protein BBI00_01460 [Chryseobacterium arthrosphaerae]|uniref:Uncharacterized protein n=1 Tax=Chryseobacterium arthrosphaerae TaxID=651561 RepID=A0A1B8ZNB7_9FLAO|nr:hypothetical protein BBI00_01460 [Chryseobacterium arthrosphaerae]
MIGIINIVFSDSFFKRTIFLRVRIFFSENSIFVDLGKRWAIKRISVKIGVFIKFISMLMKMVCQLIL